MFLSHITTEGMLEFYKTGTFNLTGTEKPNICLAKHRCVLVKCVSFFGLFSWHFPISVKWDNQNVKCALHLMILFGSSNIIDRIFHVSSEPPTETCSSKAEAAMKADWLTIIVRFQHCAVIEKICKHAKFQSLYNTGKYLSHSFCSQYQEITLLL